MPKVPKIAGRTKPITIISNATNVHANPVSATMRRWKEVNPRSPSTCSTVRVAVATGPAHSCPVLERFGRSDTINRLAATLGPDGVPRPRAPVPNADQAPPEVFGTGERGGRAPLRRLSVRRRRRTEGGAGPEGPLPPGGD